MGMNHRSAPVSVRETVAFDAEEALRGLEALSERTGGTEAAVDYYTKGYAIEAERARYPGTFCKRRLKALGKFDESWDAPSEKE